MIRLKQLILKKASVNTVNAEIFARIIFSRNFADAKFRENKTLAKWRITISFTEKYKSCPSREFLASQICLLMLFAKIKFSRKFPNLQYSVCYTQIFLFSYHIHSEKKLNTDDNSLLTIQTYLLSELSFEQNRRSSPQIPCLLLVLLK